MVTIRLIAAPDVPAERVDEMSGTLLDELNCIPGLDASRAAGEPSPAGSKNVLSAATELLLAVGGGASGLAALITVVRDWRERQRHQVTVTIQSEKGSVEFKGDSLPSDLSEMIAKLQDQRDSD